MHDNRKVSGPVNVIRLEGNVEGVNKVFYTFSDFHMNLGRQTECTELFSTKIEDYFLKNFYEMKDKPDIKYDFFLETQPSTIYYNVLGNRTWIYLLQLRKMFNKMFKYNEEENKVDNPDIFTNLRLHYLDIRDYIGLNLWDTLIDTMHIVDDLRCDYNMYSYGTRISSIVSLLTKTVEELMMTHNIIIQTRDKKNDNNAVKLLKPYEVNTQNPEFIKDVTYIYRKIQNKYTHKKIADLMRNIMDNIAKGIEPFIQFINDVITKCQEYVKYYRPIPYLETENSTSGNVIIQYKPQLVSIIGTSLYINTAYHSIFVEYLNLFAQITDVFMLRRFLDKDYITNAIVYTGGYHSNNYIRILVKYCGFKITHTAYRSIDDLSELEQKIRDSTSNSDLAPLFFPPKLEQCSDLEGFPPLLD